MQNAPPIIYCDDNYVFGRKRSGLPSTRGQKRSFLDILQETDETLWGEQQDLGREEEYGLLNRLDTPTSGLLLFARHDKAKKHYKTLESVGAIQKIYYAQTYGWPRGRFGRITKDIYHHAQLEDRMVTNAAKGRDCQQAATYREYLEDDGEKAWLRVVIAKGVRHQIRIHLASLGCPIVGDSLYMGSSLRKKFSTDLHDDAIELVSAGVVMDKSIFTRK